MNTKSVVGKVQKNTQNDDAYEFWCPGCEMFHWFATSGTPQWKFNGDLINPTISPSIRVRWEYNQKEMTCHLFVEKGKIRYLNDCHHHLHGQTIDMVPIDEADV